MDYHKGCSEYETIIESVFLKKAVIETLENRPDNSSKDEDLVKHVLKFVGVVLRGREHRAFTKRMRQVVGGLKRAAIIEQYKTSKNKRVRLTKTHLNARKMRPNLFDKDAEVPQETTVMNVSVPTKKPTAPYIEDTDDDIIETLDKSSSLSPNVPELEDPIDESDQTVVTVRPDIDDNTGYLLSILTNNEKKPITQPRAPDFESSGDIKASASVDEYFNAICNEFNNAPDIVTTRKYDELHVQLSTDSKQTPPPYTIGIGYLRARRMFLAQATFQLVEKAASDLLRLSGSTEFSSAIGVTMHKGNSVYVVKRLIGIHSAPPQYIAEIALQFINETRRVADLLGQYQ